MLRCVHVTFFLMVLFGLALDLHAQTLTNVGEGWANNSVNATVFRKNSLVTAGGQQYIAYYAADGYLMLGKRKLKSKRWKTIKTNYQGNVVDAHNSISIMVDGDGYLHVSWDHHDHPLRYAKGIKPGSLTLGSMESMTGQNESHVTYPQFFKLPDGDLLFMYRSGSSGRGNLVINKYDRSEKKWSQIQQNLISGENTRNAYWQACIDHQGVIHVSWVWRESWRVETNHDLCYARSRDGGVTWENSKGDSYQLPITAATSEYVSIIPQGRELINQTSMTIDKDGVPYIASYWRDEHSDIPQYRIVYPADQGWKTIDLGFRKTSFSLTGGGTKIIPISRPQIVATTSGDKVSLFLIFRDEERGSKVSVAVCSDIAMGYWTIKDLTDFSVGAWEPTFDTVCWKERKELYLFVQRVEQVDNEGRADIPPQMVQVLEVESSLFE